MKLGLINSAWVQAGQPTSFGLRKTKEIGFDTVDIFVDPLDLDVREKRLIQDTCRELDLPIVSLPCVAVGLADPSESVRAFHRRRVRAYLDLAYLYGATNVLVVIGEYIWNKEVIPPSQQWRWAVDGLRELGLVARELGLKIVVELEPFPLSLVNNIDTMVELLDDVDLDTVQANIDVSHLVLSRVKPEELRRLRGRAGHAHISDCDGNVHGDLPPGRGVVPFAPYLHEIKDLAIDGAISIELEFAPQPERIVEWVEEAYRETNRLLAAHKLRD
ncbi:MAG: sugar phosphate isomerase/epimerase [Planctomycetia bacterium]|nr:sugar phosphate isomerase/epimerase [Planctomycetia bacterium]